MLFKVLCQDIPSLSSIPIELGVLIESTEQYENRFEELKSHLSANEIKQANRFVSDNHKKRYIIRKGRLREELSKELNCQPDKVEFCLNDFNKPYLESTDLVFNFSHSDNYFALIKSDKFRQLGIDIETTNKKADLLDLTENYFSEPEKKYVYRTNRLADKILRFLTIWTRKEAFLKLIGTGLINDLKGISLINGENQVIVNELTYSPFTHINIRTVKHTDYVLSMGWCM